MDGAFVDRPRQRQDLVGQAEQILPLPRLVNEGFVHHGFARRSPCMALLDEMDNRLAAARRSGLEGRLLEEALRQWQRRQTEGKRP